MEIIISPRGDALAVYDEAIDLATIGRLSIRRASHVEPDDQGRWFADLAPVSGPQLGPFGLRSEALAAERAWLEVNWLNGGSCSSAGFHPPT
jgi:hypothetical protein